jgi:ABC transport system ATP-binding/permease protein
VAANSAASNNSKTSKKVEAKVVEAKEVSASPAPAPAAAVAAAVAAPGSKLNYNERKEFNKLEKEIEKLGVQIGDFEDKLAAASSAGQGYSALAELTEKMNALIMSRESKEQRWMELADNDA